jgi:hypothetical protein
LTSTLAFWTAHFCVHTWINNTKSQNPRHYYTIILCLIGSMTSETLVSQTLWLLKKVCCIRLCWDYLHILWFWLDLNDTYVLRKSFFVNNIFFKSIKCDYFFSLFCYVTKTNDLIFFALFVLQLSLSNYLYLVMITRYHGGESNIQIGPISKIYSR